VTIHPSFPKTASYSYMRFRAEVPERRLGVGKATDKRGAWHVATKFPAPPVVLSVEDGAADTSQTGRTAVADAPPAMSATLVRPRLHGYLPVGADLAASVRRYRSRSESLGRIAGLLPCLGGQRSSCTPGPHNAPYSPTRLRAAKRLESNRPHPTTGGSRLTNTRGRCHGSSLPRCM
jgi:hypothetical protein